MKSTCVLPLAAIAGLLGLPAACSSQASSDYPGEPLLIFSGAVVAAGAGTSPLPAAKAGILWYGVKAMVGASVPVTGTFPSSFTLSLHWPPPDSSGIGDPLPPMTQQHNVTLDRGPLKLGWIVALSPDTNEDDVQPGDVLGYALDTMVAYLDQDPDPATALGQEIIRFAQLWHIPATRGYHLVKLERSDRTTYDQCRWNGLCVEFRGRQAQGFRTFTLAALQADYQACRASSPDAPHCAVQDRLSADEPITEESAACFELERQIPRRTDCIVPLRHVANPAGAAAPVTITMGVSFREVFM
jgi:hypothetical protein